ncbi:MAG: S49 family peptidase, partial [Desulfovibrionaceae bacterium]
PCAAYADGLCASAAFWLASATGRIYAPLTAQVGSVGVVAVHADWSKYNEKIGIAYTYLTGGTFKAVGNEDNPLSEKDKAYLQHQITALHDIFAMDVTKHLHLKSPRSAWAEGQTFLATEAQSLGLVTNIVADLSAAVQKLAEEHMTKAELAQQFPELLAEIQAEAVAQAKAELAERATTANPQQAAEVTRTETLALVTAVLGEAASAKVQAVAAAGISAQQFTALAPLLQAHNPQTPAKAEDDLSQKILAGITAAHGQPLNGVGIISPTASLKNPLVADAERRCK